MARWTEDQLAQLKNRTKQAIAESTGDISSLIPKNRGKSYKDFLGAEDLVQIAIMDYVKLVYPEAVCYHPPNEGKRTKFEQYKINVLGVKAGFPDLFIVYKNKIIALELKAENRNRNNAVSDAQVEWIMLLNRAGIPSQVAFGFDEGREFIDKHFKNI